MNKRRIIIIKDGKIIYDKPAGTLGCETTITKFGLEVIDCMEINADYEKKIRSTIK